MVMEKLWFKRKRYGWGWIPSTIEGWIATIGYVVVVVAAFVIPATQGQSQPELIQWIIFGAMTIVLIITAYEKGETPRWQWNGKPIKKCVCGVCEECREHYQPTHDL